MEDTQFIKVANREDLPPDTIKLVKVDGQDVALCRAGDNFYALADRCTHEDAPLDEGCIVDEQLECPWHGARFDLKTGDATCLPAVTGVPIYAVELRGNEVWLNPTPRRKS